MFRKRRLVFAFYLKRISFAFYNVLAGLGDDGWSQIIRKNEHANRSKLLVASRTEVFFLKSYLRLGFDVNGVVFFFVFSLQFPFISA